ncbi:MAG TPA: N-succinylarginine dihydrolase [Polyangiaceae bacterium]|nr:N-succinylarginine dihydrolase [Polyangiaceae bacterium]
MPAYREYNFDGIVGPTHHYGGLSSGNLASTRHRGLAGNPRAAALEGLEKMRFVAGLGVGQAVLPPQPRPPLDALTALGYGGDLARSLTRLFDDSLGLGSRLFSASAMWTANAATVVPSCDASDAKVHLVVANLSAMSHRSLEPPITERVLRKVFAAPQHFQVHAPLPAYLGDEGAANQLRLSTSQASLHLLAWGRCFDHTETPRVFRARQSLEASQAVQRLCRLPTARTMLRQQAPHGIDAGAFHSDVLAVSNGHVLLLHEYAFLEPRTLLDELSRRLGPEFTYCLASDTELSLGDAVSSYPFNSQLASLADGNMILIAPAEARACEPARAFLERALSEVPALAAVHYVDVNGSMKNGGGPACLRLRVLLNETERSAIEPRVFFDDDLHQRLKHWVEQHYRSTLSIDDFRDPQLIEETLRALDELTQILELGSVYPFQQSAG